MATAKKGAKSNKTAHVLNLLTAPGAAKEAPAEPTPEDEGVPQTVIPAEVPETAGRPLAPPVLEVARSNEVNLLPPPSRSPLLLRSPPPPAASSPRRTSSGCWRVVSRKVNLLPPPSRSLLLLRSLPCRNPSPTRMSSKLST